MDMGERYYQLSLLGRVSFVEAVAPAALVAQPTSAPRTRMARGTDNSELFGGAKSAETDEILDLQRLPWQPELKPLAIIPLCKSPGTPFVDLITLGRTKGNDILLNDPSVSRFQAFFRQRLGKWYICDAGSRNGTYLAGERLPARTEALVQSRDLLQFGNVQLTFYTADALFDLLAHGD
jgi:hypothetical protein